MSKSLLITRPNHDSTTNYLYFWSEAIVAEAKRKQIPTFDLKGEKAKKTTFLSFLRSKLPRFLCLNGHGDASSITGQDNEVILDKTIDSGLISQRIIYARSCDSAKILGPTIIRQGAAAFIGYTRKFIIGTMLSKITKPLEDKLAALFLEPVNLIPTTILKGHSVSEAEYRARQEMIKNFRKMISSKSTYEERYAARWLWSNIRSQILLGDKEARI